MYNRVLIGMWKYAMTKKLRRRINKAATRILAIKIDEEIARKRELNRCGTHPLNEDCPFYCRSKYPLYIGYCLAHPPSQNFISPEDGIIGCYILPFCKQGYEVYKRMQAWKRRLKPV